MVYEWFQVDAFTDKYFQGNPCAVFIMNDDVEDDLLQKIAMEINLSETAFIFPINENNYKIRWFTPKCEVDLCGHGTLSASIVLFEKILKSYESIHFDSKSGELIVNKLGNGEYELDFPSDFVREIHITKDLRESISKSLNFSDFKIIGIGNKTKNLLIEVESKDILKSINPNFYEMIKIDFSFALSGFSLTSKGDDNYDFYSRYFTPWEGINEDPVTGSAHTLLATYWSKKLEKKELFASQLSKRKGFLNCIVSKDRVLLRGTGKIIIQGEFYND